MCETLVKYACHIVNMICFIIFVLKKNEIKFLGEGGRDQSSHFDQFTPGNVYIYW